MNYYKATIQYNGTDYFGFQWQKDIPTIQNDFNQALYKILSGKITTMGASRTDSGVHAIEQVVKISTEGEADCEILFEQLNIALPHQIRCLKISKCSGTFRPASDTISKEYRYLFTNILRPKSCDQNFIPNNPYPLDLDLMKKCCLEIIGRHDFRNFCSAGSNIKNTEREIIFCEISEIDPHFVLPVTSLFPLPKALERCYQLRIEGDGFLKQMIRHLMSALYLVGNKKMSMDKFSLLIKGSQRTERLWKVAPARGLYLYKLNYEK